MPSDIMGTNIINEARPTASRVFTFQPGPLFAQIVLADEINRATPKTQSALLEAMQEAQLSPSVAPSTSLQEPFFVMATQNPLGTGGNLSVARGAARPLFLQAGRQLFDA